MGGDWKQFLSASFLGIVSLAILIPTVIRAQNSDLTDEEKTYVVDMENFGVVEVLRKYLFPDMDIKRWPEYLVVMGTGIRWILFVLFFVCAMLSMSVPKIDKVETLVFGGIAILWFPPLEKIFSGKVNYKVIFFTKLIITASLLMIIGG